MSKSNPPSWVARMMMLLGRWILGLRYKREIKGLEAVYTRGRRKILFLPNHPALIDPVLLSTALFPKFAPRALADEVIIKMPVIRTLCRLAGVRKLPNLTEGGRSGAEQTREVLKDVIEGLNSGENILLYPAGQLRRGRLEELGAGSAVETLTQAVPDARLVLIRQNGLWGSRFSFGFNGEAPSFLKVLWWGFKKALINGVFFLPRRQVRYEMVELEDFPHGADRLEMNRRLEQFYNQDVQANTYVAYHFWERQKTRVLPEPEPARIKGDADSVPEVTRQLVYEKLKELTGKNEFRHQDRLSYELGLDSLSITDLLTWLEQEFGFSVGSPEALKTVGDALLTAVGEGVTAGALRLKPVPEAWFSGVGATSSAGIPEGDTINTVFLRQALANPNKVILADQASGVKTYRDLLTAVQVMKPIMAGLEGQYVGLMLPASVGAGIFYLSLLFAGKTPVMVNWTTGERNVSHSMDLLGVKKIITAKALLSKLKDQGVRLEALEDRFFMVEDLRGQVDWKRKLAGAVKARFFSRSLDRASSDSVAVVLFTSGSENLPKAVPLTHQNIMTNVRDLSHLIELTHQDVVIGMLPPFHSFGITVTTVFPLCLGMRTVYHPNPNDSATLGKIINAYKVTLLVGTPTFLSGILRASQAKHLEPLRIAVTGAEKCPEALYTTLKEQCPGLTIIEGYGITECSPVVSGNSYEAPTPYSIGKVLPSVEYRIVDVDSMAPTPKGERGMLLVRGPSIFQGYLNYTGESPFVELEGKQWYRTGDLVAQNEDGVLFFKGRLKRFIKLGGEMVSLPAIEQVLGPHFAGADDDGPTIAVEANPEASNPALVLFSVKDAGREQVNNWIRIAGLSPLHHIRKIERIDQIPILGTGKTDYRSLREQIVKSERAPGQDYPLWASPDA